MLEPMQKCNRYNKPINKKSLLGGKYEKRYKDNHAYPLGPGMVLH